MNDSEENQYEYQVPYWLALVYCACFTGVVLYLGHEIYIGNFDGLMDHFQISLNTVYIIYGLISLPLILLSIAFIALIIFQFRTEPQFLTFTDDSIKIPRTLFVKEKVIKFEDISDLKIYNVKGTSYLNIITDHGKACISSAHLKSSQDLVSIRNYLQEKTKK